MVRGSVRLLRPPSHKRVHHGRLQARDTLTSAVSSDRVRISIAFSKTMNHRVYIDLAARGDNLCPRAALVGYLRLLSPAVKVQSDAALFTVSANSCIGITDTFFISRFRHTFRLARPSAGHSFRRGGATALFLAGMPEAIIHHGRCRSQTVRAYLDSQNSGVARLEADRLLYVFESNKNARLHAVVPASLSSLTELEIDP